MEEKNLLECEKELLEQGYVKDNLCIHMQEYNESYPNKFCRLSYDFGNGFTSKQIDVLKLWVNEVNNRFANIKLSMTGTGYVKKED